MILGMFLGLTGMATYVPAVITSALESAGNCMGPMAMLLAGVVIGEYNFAYATPMGLNTIVFPAAYGGDTKTGAAMTMISSALSVITIPLMYYIFAVLL